MELSDLVGEHELTAVEQNTTTGGGKYEDSATLAFTLDGVTYVAVENPDDGYRSSMRELVCAPGLTLANTFEPQRVVGTYDGCSSDILTLTDVVTGKEVLQVGTCGLDDYYPSFVASFSPEHMAINAGGGRVA